MELFVHKFNPEAPEQTGEWVYDMISKIEDELLNKPEGSYGEQFWHKGHVDVLGYRFYPDNTEHVLVTHTDDSSNEWYEYSTPTTDPNLVHRYVMAQAGDNCAYIILDEKVKIHTA